MHLGNLSLGIGIALALVACSKTSLSKARDAAVDRSPTSEVAPPDLAPSSPDASPLVADTLAIAPDAAVAGPDTAGPAPDAAVAGPDTADASVLGPDLAALPGDSAVRTPETTPNAFANRTFHIDVANPAPTPDPACTPYERVDSFLLTFPSDTSTLNGLFVRGSAAMKFHATLDPESDKLTYHIDDFLGGGRIVIELDQGLYVGQVVIYGSGVPIAGCLRGVLTPQP